MAHEVENKDSNGPTNVRVRIERDGYPDSPRNWDNLGTMVCFHGRYDLGDKHGYNTSDEFFQDLAEEILEDADALRELSPEKIERLVLSSREVVILPLYLLDHSGLRMDTDTYAFRACDPQGWDWGQVGWIYVTLRKAREELGGWTTEDELRQAALRTLREEVEVYDAYLRGEVYGYCIEKEKTCPTCGHVDYEVIDSCTGFYGEDGLKEIRQILKEQGYSADSSLNVDSVSD